MTTTVPVEIRHYPDVGAFRRDATSMATAGWIVVGQSEGYERPNVTAWATAGIVCLVLMVLATWLFLIPALALFSVGFTARRRVIVVTYRPTIQVPTQ